ncbi:hypothetical protein HMPREF0549_1862, partial [Limosilactobacillus vaginalis DSM 5837 = ATCC 49540]
MQVLIRKEDNERKEEQFTFLKMIGEPVPKSKLVGKRVCDIIFG